MTNALAVYDNGRFEVMQRAAKAMVASGYFKDSKDVAQAVTKVMAGAELGIPPFAAMTGIHIIQGKPALGANLIATLVKNDPRYNYIVVKCDNVECGIDWYEDGKKVGESWFTYEEAKKAGLTGKDNWQKYTSDMLFARTITRGARRFTPGIFGGAPIYTPDELGVEVDADGYIDAQSVEVIDDQDGYEYAHWVDEIESTIKPFEEMIADTLSEFGSMDSVKAGFVADRLVQVGTHDNRHAALNSMRKWDGLGDKALVFSTPLLPATAVAIFNDVIQRHSES